MSADVGVVVVTYNSSEVVTALLDSLPAALAGASARVLVVDNGSADDTVEVVRRHGTDVLESTNRGYAAGINSGADRMPEVEAILVLNPDVRLEPASVRALLETMRTSRAGIVVPRLRDPEGAVTASLRRRPTLMRATGFGHTGRPLVSETVKVDETYDHRGQVDWATGAVMLIDRRCHEELGGWDESFFLYSEETDFCLRAGERGWPTVYEPDAEAVHVGGGSGRSGRTHAMQIVNRVRLYARDHGAAASWTYYALTIASEASWWVRGNPHSPAALRALLSRRQRPAELGCEQRLLPR